MKRLPKQAKEDAKKAKEDAKKAKKMPRRLRKMPRRLRMMPRRLRKTKRLLRNSLEKIRRKRLMSPQRPPKRSPQRSPKRSPQRSPKRSPQRSPKRSPQRSPKRSHSGFNQLLILTPSLLLSKLFPKSSNLLNSLTSSSSISKIHPLFLSTFLHSPILSILLPLNLFSFKTSTTKNLFMLISLAFANSYFSFPLPLIPTSSSNRSRCSPHDSSTFYPTHPFSFNDHISHRQR